MTHIQIDSKDFRKIGWIYNADPELTGQIELEGEINRYIKSIDEENKRVQIIMDYVQSYFKRFIRKSI